MGDPEPPAELCLACDHPAHRSGECGHLFAFNGSRCLCARDQPVLDSDTSPMSE